MDIPGHGTVIGEWDLRGREQAYLGNVALAGKTVLEIGTASGHLCFWMEGQGAEVVAYDLSDSHEWDIVPYAALDVRGIAEGRKAHMRKINNAWWFAHERFKSTARVSYGTAYDVSERLGRFDIVTLSAILLHLRDPFLALQRAASVSDDTIVVTDWPPARRLEPLAQLDDWRRVRFMPDHRSTGPVETWWQVTPEFVGEALQILGFGDLTITHHQQLSKGNEMGLFTIVARRGASALRNVEDQSKQQVWTDKRALHSAIMEGIPARDLFRHLTTRVMRKFR